MMRCTRFLLANLLITICLVVCLARPVFGSEIDSTIPTPPPTADQDPQETELKTKVAGRYAHYDIVAYTAKILFWEMRTLVITYGVTEFKLDDTGRLLSSSRYCHASHKSNFPFKSEVPDAFTRAIIPRDAWVEIRRDQDDLSLWRPETPTPIGIRMEDPDQPLPKDPSDPRIADDDGDGKPGVTVKIRLYDRFDTELYIARREIFAYALKPQADGTLSGYVSDHSEQLILGSPFPPLRKQNAPTQNPDLTLSPILLVPIDESYDCERMMEERDVLFPAEPDA
jgi:hypothetical protein